MSGLRKRLLGLRLDAIAHGRYIGICTRTQHVAVLTSGKRTYCAWHRWRSQHEPVPIHYYRERA